jgi:cysteine-rich repeat protein
MKDVRVSFLLAALALGACAPDAPSSPPGLGVVREPIVGGHNANIADFPYQAMVIGNGVIDGVPKQILCGGVILDPSWVLTAAHCGGAFLGESTSPDPTSFTVYAGITHRSDEPLVGQAGHPGQKSSVSQVVIFPGWIPIFHTTINQTGSSEAAADAATTAGRDIALLRLSQPLTIGPGVATISRITPLEASLGWTAPGTTATVSGWGTLASGGSAPDTLQAVDLPIVPIAGATTVYPGFPIGFDQMPVGVFLTGGVSPCNGDSGGPVTVTAPSGGQRYLAGTVSWGQGCAAPELPTMTARTEYFSDWIDEVMKSTPPFDPCQSTALAAWYPFDATGGSTLFSTGQGREVEEAMGCGGPGFVEGSTGINNDLVFNRSTSEAFGTAFQGHPVLPHIFPHLSLQDGVGAPARLTVEIWVRPDGSSDGTIVDASSFALRRVGSTGNVQLDLQDPNPSSGAPCSSLNTFNFTGTVLPLNEWHHLAFTYDPALGQVQAYLDGEAAGGSSVTGTAAAVCPVNAALTVGANQTGKVGFTGALDELRIYRTARSANEICQDAGGLAVDNLGCLLNKLTGAQCGGYGQVCCDVSNRALACEEGTCQSGVCQSTCGNSMIEPGEQCDDGNTNNQDGCTNTCLRQGNIGDACLPGNQCNPGQGVCLNGTVCTEFGGAFEITRGGNCLHGNPLGGGFCACPPGFPAQNTVEFESQESPQDLPRLTFCAAPTFSSVYQGMFSDWKDANGNLCTSLDGTPNAIGVSGTGALSCDIIDSDRSLLPGAYAGSAATPACSTKTGVCEADYNFPTAGAATYGGTTARRQTTSDPACAFDPNQGADYLDGYCIASNMTHDCFCPFDYTQTVFPYQGRPFCSPPTPPEQCDQTTRCPAELWVCTRSNAALINIGFPGDSASTNAQVVNLVANPGFDTDASGWRPEVDISLSWSAVDAAGAAASGSLVVENDDVASISGFVELGAEQCVPVQRTGTYDFSAQAYNTAGQGNNSAAGTIELVYFKSVDCSGSWAGVYQGPFGSAPNQWSTLAGTPTLPASTQSVLVRLLAYKPFNSPPVHILFDNVVLRAH